MKEGTSIAVLAEEMCFAAINIQPERLEELLCSLECDEEKRELTARLEDNRTFAMVSLLGAALRDYGQWREPERIRKRRSENLRQTALFKRYLGVCVTTEIPSVLLEDVCKGEDDDILERPKMELLDRGYREIDLDLRVACSRLDYRRVEELLRLGADPEVAIDGVLESAADFAHAMVDCNLGVLYPILVGDEECNRWTEAAQLMEYAAYDHLLWLFHDYS